MMRYALILFAIIVVGAGILWYAANQKSDAIPAQPEKQPTQTDNTLVPEISDAPAGAETKIYKELNTRNIEGVAQEFQFSVEIPNEWVAETIEEIEAINLYDPQASGNTNLEKSQVFIRHFEAARFLTLQTVSILEREEKTVVGRPAVRYVIEKKAGVADFPHQPSWRNVRHVVTDVRVSDASPSVFYVIAQRPDLDNEIYEHVLQTLTFL